MAKLRKNELIALQSLKTKVYSPTTVVVIEYNGYGDSGAVDEVYYEEKPDEPIDNIRVALTDLAYDLLESHFSGWPNNDGSSGRILIDFVSESVLWEHHENYVAVHTVTSRGVFGDKQSPDEQVLLSDPSKTTTP